MKIAFLIKYFYPYKWWAENNCYFLAKELTNKHEVHIFCSGVENSEEKIDWIFVHRCKNLFEISYYLSFYPSLFKKIYPYRFHIIHVHGIWFFQQDIVIKFLKIKFPETRLVCTPHGPFMPKTKNIFWRTFRFFYTPFIKFFLKDYDLIIQVNPHQHKWLIEEYWVPQNCIKFLPNGISDWIFVKQNFHKSELFWSLLKGKFVISYIGRIQQYKWIDQMIKVLPKLLKGDANIVFVIVGRDAWDKKRLEKLSVDLWVDKNVIFTGEIDEYQKYEILDISEIFVFPSEWEAFGIVLLEAMAYKNSIISTKTEGGSYLIKPGENGYLYDFWDLNSLAHLLSLLINNPQKRYQIEKKQLFKI